MKKKVLPLLLLLASCFLLLAPSSAWLDWQTLKTDHFTIYYKWGYQNKAWETLRSLEYNRNFIEKLTGNEVLSTPVVLEDIGELSNAYSDPVFKNIHLFTYAAGTGSLEYYRDWMNYLSVHEYTHILHLKKAGGFPGAVAEFFGKGLSPNLISPSWLVEGLAVYSESRASKFAGRLNYGLYKAYVEAAAYDNKLPSIMKAASNSMEFPYGEGIYYYGGVFIDHLSKKYGEDKITSFINNYGSSIPLLEIDKASRKSFGKTLPQLWQEWEVELAKDAKTDISDGQGTNITNAGGIIASPVIYNGRLYYQKNYPVKTGAFNTYRVYQIIERDLTTGKERIINSPSSAFSTPLKIRSGKLYFGCFEMRSGYKNNYLNSYGYCTVIKEIDITKGDLRNVLEGDIRDFEVLSDGTIIYSKDRKGVFGSDIYIYDNSGSRSGKPAFSSDLLIDKLVSDGNMIFAAAKTDRANYNVFKLDIKNGNLSQIIGSPYFESYPSVYGKRLYFAANFDNQNALFCYDTGNKKVYKIDAGSWSASPAYDEDSKTLYYVGINSSGYDIYSKKAAFVEYTSTDQSATDKWSLPDIAGTEGEHTLLNNLSGITPSVYYPQLLNSYNKNLLGVGFSGKDPIEAFYYSSAMYYDSSIKKLYGSLMIDSRFLAPVATSLFYNNFDENSLGMDLDYPFFIRLSAGLSYLSAGLTAQLSKNDFTRKIFTPHFSSSLRFLGTWGDLSNTLFLPFESRSAGSTIDRTGLYSNTILSNNLSDSRISVNIVNIYDPSNPDTVFPVLRGYATALNDKIGNVLRFDYSKPLIKIREGSWSTSIFLDDLCGNVFIDTAKGDRGSLQASAGIELHQETRSLFVLPVDLGIRFAVNKENEKSLALLVGLQSMGYNRSDTYNFGPALFTGQN